MFSTDFDDDLDLDELFEDVKLPEANMYISDDDNAVSLVSELIKNKSNNPSNPITIYLIKVSIELSKTKL